MGKLEDIEARLERLERPCLPTHLITEAEFKALEAKWLAETARLVYERDENLAARDIAQHVSSMQSEARMEAERQRDEARARIEFLSADNEKLAVSLRDAEDRARTSLRLWKEFGRKLDEKYPGRDKGEASDDYALRMLKRYDEQLAMVARECDEASHR